MMVIYTDDCIIASKDPDHIKTTIQELAWDHRWRRSGWIPWCQGWTQEWWQIWFLQPQLIEQILTALGFNDRTKQKGTTALSSKILQRDAEGTEHNTSWDKSLPISTSYKSQHTPTKHLQSTTVQDMRQIPGRCTSMRSWELAGTSSRHKTWIGSVSQCITSVAVVWCWILWKLGSGDRTPW